jgi:glucosylceramidase
MIMALLYAITPSSNRSHFIPEKLMIPTMVTACSRAIPSFVLGYLLLAGATSHAQPSTPDLRGDDHATRPKSARIYMTDRESGKRLSEVETASFAPMEQPEEHSPAIMLDASKTFQTIVGIGGALTDASAETFYKMPADRQKELLTAFFDREKGSGYSLSRTSIHTCDFSSSSYSYDDVAGDTGFTHFSIAPDLKFKIPFIRAAAERAGGELKLLASPWSPPAWMKTNNTMLQGGKLRAEYRQAWADYFVRFVREYEKAGIPVWGLTVQNEPMAVQTWESCIFSAAEERDFVKNFLGPTLQRSGLSRVKLLAWDHNRGIMYQRAQLMYDDPLAAQYVWGTAFHWYVGDHFDNVKLVHDAFPGKELMFTEGSVEKFDAGRLLDWSAGETYARSMINDFNNWASGWLCWNVLLDEQGGPNHVGNFCMAPIIGDTRTGQLTYTNSFYYIAHFSRFIRPGACRIVCSSNSDDLLATAFVNPDGQIAVVVFNGTDRATDFKTWIDGTACTAKSPAHSIVTLVLK